LPSAPLVNIEPSEDTLQFAERVRRFVAKNADMGFTSNSLCDTFTKIPISEFNPSKYLSVFKADSGVASCGLAGQIMVKILLENGIDAYTYNFGFDGTPFTHIMVLIKYGGRYLIYDPFINYTLLDASGNKMDLQRLLMQIAGDSLELKFSEDTVQTDVLINRHILPSTLRELLLSNNCVELSDLATHVRDSIYKMPMPRCFACEFDERCLRFVPAFEKHLSTHTKFTKFHEGMALKINEIYGADDHERVNAMVDSLIAELPELSVRIGR